MCPGGEGLTCFSRNRVGGRVWLRPGLGPQSWRFPLPPRLRCPACTLQWRWVAGNNWADCGNGTAGLGCGPQEEFRACADIRIKGRRAAENPWTPKPNKNSRKPSKRPTRRPSRRPSPATTPRPWWRWWKSEAGHSYNTSSPTSWSFVWVGRPATKQQTGSRTVVALNTRPPGRLPVGIAAWLTQLYQFLYKLFSL